MTGVSVLAGLVDKELMAGDWAEVLAPVDGTVGRLGAFLREEVASGRGYLPAGDAIFHAFRRPLADVRVLVVGQDPYPTPGHPIGAQLRGGARRVAGCRGAWSTSTSSCATTPASCRRSTASSPDGPTRA